MAKTFKKHIELSHNSNQSLFATDISIEFNNNINIKNYIDNIDNTLSNTFQIGESSVFDIQTLYFGDSNSYLSLNKLSEDKFILSNNLEINGTLSTTGNISINGSTVATLDTDSLTNYLTSTYIAANYYTNDDVDYLIDTHKHFLNATNFHDVVITSLANKDLLSYDSITSKWINRVGRLSDLIGDVNITSPSNNNVLVYSSSTSKWINSTISTSMLPSTVVYTNTAQTISGNKTFSGSSNSISGTFNVPGTINVTNNGTINLNNTSVFNVGATATLNVNGILNINSKRLYHSNEGWYTSVKYDVLSTPFILSGTYPFIPDPRVVGQLDARVALEGVTELGDLKDVMIRSTNKTHGKDLVGGSSYEGNFNLMDTSMHGRVLMYLDTSWTNGETSAYLKGWYPVSINPTVDVNEDDVTISINPKITGTISDTFTINSDESEVTTLYFSNDSNRGAITWYPSGTSYGYGINDSAFEINDDVFIFGDVKTFGLFIGDGSEIENINAANIETGILNDNRLSANIPRLNASNTFNGNQTILGSFSIRSGGATTRSITQANGSFSFDGNINVSGSLAIISGGAFTGIITQSNGTFSLMDDGTGNSNLTLGGTVTAANFSGSGTALTGVAKLASTNTFTASQTFSGTQVRMGNATRNTINFGTAGVGLNATGLKIKLYGNINDNTFGSGDYGIGIESGNIYHITGGGYKWYLNNNYNVNTPAMNLDSSGNLTTRGNLDISLGNISTRTIRHRHRNLISQSSGYGTAWNGHTSWATHYEIPNDLGNIRINSFSGSISEDVYLTMPDITLFERGESFIIEMDAVRSSDGKFLYIRPLPSTSQVILAPPPANYIPNTNAWKIPFQENMWWEFYKHYRPNAPDAWCVRIGYLPNTGTNVAQ